MWALLLFADQRLAAHWETFQQSSRSSCRKIFCVEGAFLGCVRHVSGIVTPAARRLSTVGTRKAGPRSVSRTVVGGRPSYCCDTLAQVDCRWLPCPALLVSHFGISTTHKQPCSRTKVQVPCCALSATPRRRDTRWSRGCVFCRAVKSVHSAAL